MQIAIRCTPPYLLSLSLPVKSYSYTSHAQSIQLIAQTLDLDDIILSRDLKIFT